MILKEQDIKEVIGRWVLGQEISFPVVHALLLEYIKERVGPDVMITIQSMAIAPPLVTAAMASIKDYYADKYNMYTVHDKNLKITKVLWM